MEKFSFLTVSIDGVFRKWTSFKHDCVETFQSNEEVAFSKVINGNVLLTIGDSVKLWDLNSFELKKWLPKFNNFIISYKLDGNKIFISFANGVLECWNLDNKSRIFSIQAHEKIITSIKVITNKYILTASKDCMINMWDYDTGEQIRSFVAHRNKVFRLKMISDSVFASCSEDKTLCIWDIKNERYLRMLVGHQSKVLNMKYGNDLLVTASFDCTIRYWNVHTGRNTKILKGHTGGIVHLKLFLQENRLVSTSTDKLIFVWDFADGLCLQKFAGHEDFVLDVKLINENFFLSASHDGTVKIWEIGKSKFLASFRNYLSPLINIHKIE